MRSQCLPRHKLPAAFVFIALAICSGASSPLDASDELPEFALRRVGARAFSHGEYITKMFAIPETSQVVTVGMEHSVQLWNGDGELQATIPRNLNGLNTSYSQDGRWRLESCREESPEGSPQRGSSYRYVIRNLLSGQERQLGPVTSPAESLSISGDGRLLAVGSRRGQLSLIDTLTEESLDTVTLPAETNVAGHPRTVMAPDASMLLVEQPRGTWHVFDLQHRDLAHRLPALEKPFPHATPVLSSQPFRGAMVGWNGEIALRDFKTGQTFAEFRHGRVTALGGAFSPDRQTFASCGADGYVRLWNTKTGEQTLELNTQERHPHAVAFSRSGKQLLSAGGDGRVRFWEIATGNEIPTAEPGTGFGAIKAVALSQDGDLAALAGGMGRVVLWDLASGNPLGELPDDAGNGRFDSWLGHDFLQFSTTDGVLVAGSSSKHNSVNLWDVTALRRAGQRVSNRWPITGVACSRDGEMIASGSRDGMVRAWKRSGEQLWEGKGNGAQILTLDFHPDDNRLLTAGHTNLIDVWNRADGQLLEQIAMDRSGRTSPSNTISALSLSHDGRYLAAVMGSSTTGDHVSVLDLQDQNQVLEIDHHSHGSRRNPDDAFFGVRFHPLANVLCMGTGKGTVELYRVPDGELITTLNGHRGRTTSVSWNADGSRLLSGSFDGTAVLWDTDSVLNPSARPVTTSDDSTSVATAAPLSTPSKSLQGVLLSILALVACLVLILAAAPDSRDNTK